MWSLLSGKVRFNRRARSARTLPSWLFLEYDPLVRGPNRGPVRRDQPLEGSVCVLFGGGLSEVGDGAAFLGQSRRLIPLLTTAASMPLWRPLHCPVAP